MQTVLFILCGLLKCAKELPKTNNTNHQALGCGKCFLSAFCPALLRHKQVPMKTLCSYYILSQKKSQLIYRQSWESYFIIFIFMNFKTPCSAQVRLSKVLAAE